MKENNKFAEESDLPGYHGSFLERITLQGVFKGAAVITASVFLWSVLVTPQESIFPLRFSSSILEETIVIAVVLGAVVVLWNLYPYPRHRIQNYARWAAIAGLVILSLRVSRYELLLSNTLLMYVLLLFGIEPGERDTTDFVLAQPKPQSGRQRASALIRLYRILAIVNFILTPIFLIFYAYYGGRDTFLLFLAGIAVIVGVVMLRLYRRARNQLANAAGLTPASAPSALPEA